MLQDVQRCWAIVAFLALALPAYQNIHI